LISTQVAAPVLAGKQMTVKWGTSTVRTYVIPAMQPQKNSLVFKYSGLEKTSDKRINATFDFEKGVFMIRIAKAYMVSVPTSTTSQNLVLQFAADSTHNFDKTVAVFAH
jgi:hypothetical protein